MRDFKNLPVGEMFIVGDKILVVKKKMKTMISVLNVSSEI